MNGLLKYHKALFAAVAVLIPGADGIVDFIDKLGIDWSALATAAGSGSLKVWLLAGLVALLPYVVHTAQEQNKDEAAAELKALVNELKARLPAEGAEK